MALLTESLPPSVLNIQVRMLLAFAAIDSDL